MVNGKLFVQIYSVLVMKTNKDSYNGDNHIDIIVTKKDLAATRRTMIQIKALLSGVLGNAENPCMQR